MISLNNEQDLLLRLKSNDQAAFNELYRKYERKIFYNLSKLVHSNHIAAELHQDVFLKVWQSRSQLNTELPFEAFLVTIAKNMAIDFYRSTSRNKKLMDHLISLMTELHDPITDLMEAKDYRMILENAVSKLPPQRQLVFRYIKLEDKSYENAAVYFGVSVGTIKDHMAKAMAFLKEEMNNNKFDLLLLYFIHLYFR
ncbi:RNA polymerase sigma factor [Pedobacter nutrimenti]|uniref:RNA polymerase sigma factor n=1 Tax=Pedobacter nutrimenti TaxID=1241337 RepID=UPI00292E25CC|nr:sigma-70 family RNA polymerase sigma factor [Pedobacter nutrimenti]